ncbi:MAG: hypothetical protein IMY72_06765 [Bacteroidetes bacterium]|nr:hypothetical protein [Bacteroidota bacterium]
MKTLETYYNDLFNKPEKWNYYGGKLSNPIYNNSYDNFLKEYIKPSGKGDSNPLMETLNRVDYKGHVFSVFFLGILLYENCKKIRDQIDIKIKYYKKVNNHSEISFSFIWFIISLFHDSGYRFEEKNEYKKIEHVDIDYKLKKYKGGIPKQISNTWRDYFKYKLNYLKPENLRKPDHGILAGILLFDTLTKTYEYYKKLNGNKEEFVYHNLFWSKKLLNVYNLCSWTILAHNIFFLNVKSDDKEKIDSYFEKDLEQLVIKRGQKPVINLHNYPFLFLLCLVDTIEPSKMQSDNDLKECLKQTDMDLNHNEINIKFSKKIEKSRFDKILKMGNWLDDIETEKSDDNIKIKIV